MDDAEKRAEQLLADLDAVAREYEHYEYGLPLGIEEVGPKMVELVQVAIREAVAAAIERCAEVAEEWVDPTVARVRPEHLEDYVGCLTAFNEGCECSAPEGIAQAIREGKEKA